MGQWGWPQGHDGFTWARWTPRGEGGEGGDYALEYCVRSGELMQMSSCAMGQIVVSHFGSQTHRHKIDVMRMKMCQQRQYGYLHLKFYTSIAEHQTV